MGVIDVGVIVLYLVVVIGLGCLAGLRRKKGADAESYFLAGGSLTWPVIGLALFSTNISTVHLVSLAQEGYKNGLAYGSFEWMAAFTLICLALFFAPFYVRSRVATLPDFLEKRYSRASRDLLAVISIISAVFIHIGFSLYAGAVVLQGLFGINIYVSIITVALLTGLYTIIGGLLAVVWTESLQTVVLLVGASLLTGIAYVKAGCWSGLSAAVEPIKLQVLRPAGDASGLPWYAVMLGYPIIGIWYWCADQTIVQRVLWAKDENHARVGALFAGFIKILPVFILVFPGLICAALINQGKLPDQVEDSANVYAFMITHLLPVGLRGIMAAALLAALMSTVSGALNSVATLFAYDLYKRRRPDISDERLIVIGRVVTFVGMVLAILWSPFVSRFESVFQGIVAVICYVSPPITVVFVTGIFWRGASSRGSIATFVTGMALGFVVFCLEFFKAPFWNVSNMMASFYLACICEVVLIGVSLCYPDPDRAELDALVWRNPLDAFSGAAWKGLGNYKLLSLILFVVMVILYCVF